MIKVNIQEVARLNEVENAYQLQKKLGLQPSVAAAIWRSEFSKVALTTLDKLCGAFNCQPGDLLIYKPDKAKRGKATK